jgi:hypothetical protein
MCRPQFQDGLGQRNNIVGINNSPKAEGEKLRKQWVCPLLSTRLQKCLFHTLYEDLQKDRDFF